MASSCTPRRISRASRAAKPSCNPSRAIRPLLYQLSGITSTSRFAAAFLAEIQRFGDVAVLYSQYVLETETNGKRSEESGRVTEIFVWRDGHWVNPGWHTDSVK
jgi:hypothetical protein